MKDSSSRWIENAIDIATIYRDDPPMADNLDIELICWETKWRDYVGDIPSKPSENLACLPTTFPPIFTPFFKLFVLYL